jgi:hypothetical protein
MQLARPGIAPRARQFGRGPVRVLGTAPAEPLFNEDLKLFATTFLAGFVFVTIYLA